MNYQRVRTMLTVVVGLLFLAVILSSCGRDASRMLGKDYRQKLTVPHMVEFISISFDKRGSSTVKDVTFKATDGYIYTQEFKDVSPLEGVIRWVPYGEGSGIVRTRAISRWTGTPVDLELPQDCGEILGVDVGYESEDTRVKNLTYRNTSGKILSKEYREGIKNRFFEGWLEVVAAAAAK